MLDLDDLIDAVPLLIEAEAGALAELAATRSGACVASLDPTGTRLARAAPPCPPDRASLMGERLILSRDGLVDESRCVELPSVGLGFLGEATTAGTFSGEAFPDAELSLLETAFA